MLAFLTQASAWALEPPHVGHYVSIACESDAYALGNNRADFGPGTYRIDAALPQEQFQLVDTLSQLKASGLPPAQGILRQKGDDLELTLRGIVDSACLSGRSFKKEAVASNAASKIPVVFTMKPKASGTNEYVGTRTLCGLEKVMQCQLVIEADACSALTREMLQSKERVKVLKAAKSDPKGELKEIKEELSRLRKAYASASCAR